MHILSAKNNNKFDVEELPTHGGSLRVYGCHRDDCRADSGNVTALLKREHDAGLQLMAPYSSLQSRAERIKDDLLLFLIEQKRAGKRVAGYGAAAKGNTLLNFAGVGPDLLPFVCDAAPAKQGKFMPGSHIPIKEPAVLDAQPPDYLIILPWNIAAEVRQQLAHLERSGTRFVTAVPQLTVSAAGSGQPH